MTDEEKQTQEGLFGRVGRSAKEFLYGMAGHDMTRFALKTRGSMEHLFILITMGDLLGVPILPPYYSLRLLPYVVPRSVFGESGTPPSERITIGAVGIGAQGTNDLKGFLQLADARVVAVCDVSRPARDRGLTLVNEKYADGDCSAYHDYYDMLGRDDIDAVSIVTPYHWHSIMALAAVRAGKDIFLEKPVAMTVQEAKMVRRAVHRYGSVSQLGTQQRSGRDFRFACELALNGRLGKLHAVKVGTSHGRVTPNLPAMPVPDWLDYDRWLGPAPWSPYND